MNVIIKKGLLNGSIKVPPSKSYAHRYLIASALSKKGEVLNIDYSKDIEATISCLSSLGVSYIRRFDSIEFENNFTRSDAIIAVGGGVVGDLAGFIASTYMRGIDYIQVPTTLLAMVDSSVGGKTAIDLDNYKNLVGTFYQPSRVFININFLETLNRRQYNSGLGEILKYAFIEDNCEYSKPIFLFEYLTLCAEKISDSARCGYTF